MATDSTNTPEHLPVFPLATVLFPGAVLPLHIFEERYKEMMRFAIEHGGLFGLSYRPDAEVGRETPPEVGSVGCVAKISAVMPLDEGKLNLLSTGMVRYRILELTQTSPFPICRVESFTDDAELAPDILGLARVTRRLCRQFLVEAGTLDESSDSFEGHIPDEPEAFSFIAASLLPIDTNEKQMLLELTSTRERLARLNRLIVKLTSRARRQRLIEEIAKGNGGASHIPADGRA